MASSPLNIKTTITATEIAFQHGQSFRTTLGNAVFNNFLIIESTTKVGSQDTIAIPNQASEPTT